MKIKYVSDIHLEFSNFPTNPETELGPDKEKVLLVAGDTVLSTCLKEKRTDGLAQQIQRRFDQFLDAVSGFKEVYMVSGNHESYMNGDVATNQELINDYITRKGYTNVRLLENERVPLTDKVDLLACTLWTSMDNRNPVVEQYVGGGMNDFLVSNYKGRAFLPSDAADLHFESRKWMQEQLLDTNKCYVVMTHHLPSYQGIDPQFKGDTLNHGYASEMDDFIHMNPHILFWVHGHTHYDVDYMIAHTRILGRMRGYPPGGYDRKSNWIGFTAAEFEI